MNTQSSIVALCTLTLILGAALGAPDALAKKKKKDKVFNPGLYSASYVKLVGTDEDWLIHPTGEYKAISSHREQRRHYYEPKLKYTKDMEAEALAMQDRGYVMVGYTAFNTAEAPVPLYEDPDFTSLNQHEKGGVIMGLRLRGELERTRNPLGDPVDAARWANAAIVVIQKDFAFQSQKQLALRLRASETQEDTHTRSSQYVSQNDTQGQTFEDGTTATNHFGSDIYQENNNHVSHRGQQWATTLMSRNELHFDQVATFWKKVDPSKLKLGALTQPIDPELRRALGTRHAVMVNNVVAGTPAYEADLFEGDVLLTINGERIRGTSGLDALLESHRGSSILLRLWREGEELETELALNP